MNYPRINKLPSLLSDNHTQGKLALILLAALWGLSYPLIKDSLSGVSAEDFLVTRLSVSVGAVLLFTTWQGKLLQRVGALKYSVRLGVILFGIFATQTLALNYTSSGRAAFLSSCSVFLVPVLSQFNNQKPQHLSYGVALLASVGVFLMIGPSAEPINRGDLLAASGAPLIALHMILQDSSYPPTLSTFDKLFGQLIVAWALSVPLILIGDTNSNPISVAQLPALAYCSFVLTIWGTVLYTKGLRDVSPQMAALIFTLEPVFTLFFASTYFGERLSLPQLLGATVVLLALLIDNRAGSPCTIDNECNQSVR